MGDPSTAAAVAKEKLSILNREIDLFERERDDLLKCNQVLFETIDQALPSGHPLARFNE